MKLNKTDKATIIDALVSETFADRMDKLNGMKHSLFNAVIASNFTAKEEEILNSLDKGLKERFLSKTNYALVYLPLPGKVKGDLTALDEDRLKEVCLDRERVRSAYEKPSAVVTRRIKVDSPDKEMSIVPFGFRESGCFLESASDPVFKAALDCLHTKFTIYKDREVLIKKLEQTLAGISTDKALDEFNPMWRLLLPSRSEAKPLVPSPEAVNQLIACCKEGNCGH